MAATRTNAAAAAAAPGTTTAVLNPASVPFFPGARTIVRSAKAARTDSSDSLISTEGVSSAANVVPTPESAHGHDRATTGSIASSASGFSTSPSDYRSFKSSPSPPRSLNSEEGVLERASAPQAFQFQHQQQQHFTLKSSPPAIEPARSNSASSSRRSPTFRQVDAGRPYPAVEHRAPREASLLGSLESLPEGDGILISQGGPGGGAGQPGSFAHRGRGSGSSTDGHASQSHSSGSSYFASHLSGAIGASSPYIGAGPQTAGSRTPSFSNNGAFTSSSPVSSLDSHNSHFTPSILDHQHTLEQQLKASPLIREILDRMDRCEYSTREIQRDLGEVHRKVTLLVERTLGLGSGNQPEFKDPFAVANHLSPTPGFATPNYGTARASLSGAIAPNQPAPADDITQISQRLNTLTMSVGQLLALQTQQVIHQNNGIGNAGLSVSHGTPHQRALGSGVGPGMGAAGLQDLGTHQLAMTGSLLSLGLPSRPDLRPPQARGPNNPPPRTWSAGTLDLPMRPSDGNIGRTDSLRVDKRRSFTNLTRRDSGVLDPQDGWLGGNGSNRDGGPIISKWEHLALAPELLRSLNKFGIGPPNKIQQRALPFLLRGSDIIAQAPPTQERIAAYVIPAIQIVIANTAGAQPNGGPIAIMISTTVDQATQAQRMIRDLGGPIGVRSALGVGANSPSTDISQELRLLQQNMPHIICGTPPKLHALFTAPNGLVGSEVRFMVLDEVDQLIARNLYEFVFNIVKLLPPARSKPLGGQGGTPGSQQQQAFSPDGGPARRFSLVTSSPNPDAIPPGQMIERQTALFSNTVPQDVLNLAQAIQLREPVRVLVRRDGNVAHADASQGSRGLRQFYLYLAFTAGGRSDSMSSSAPGAGLGIIGSGRGAASSSESAQAREWKLDALADLFDDVDVSQALVHVGGVNALDSVVYKLASRGLEAVPLHGDMSAGTKLGALNKFRASSSTGMRPATTKVLVVYDVQVKQPDVPHIPLVINYDLPKAVEEYAHRVSPAIASGYARAGVVVNFVTATGGDVEMLRSIECFYKIKCPEVPTSLREIA